MKMGLKMTKLSDINIQDVGTTIQMVGAAWAGNGKLYITLFPEDQGVIYSGQHKVLFSQKAWDDVSFAGSDEVPVETLNMDLDEWAKFLRQTDLLETEVLAKASDGSIAKIILRKSQRQIDAGVSWKVYKRDHYACRYCGKDDLPLTVDHLVLWEAGGPSIEANLVSACRKCNKTRGCLPYSDWLAHPYYVKVSTALTEGQRLANHTLLKTLDAVPRTIHQRSR
jgi:hypothetical protein